MTSLDRTASILSEEAKKEYTPIIMSGNHPRLILDGIKKDIKDILHGTLAAKIATRGQTGYSDEEMEEWLTETANQILSISVNGKTIEELIKGWSNGKILELALDQSLPSFVPIRGDGLMRGVGYKEAQQDMLKPDKNGSVWMKVIKEEK